MCYMTIEENLGNTDRRKLKLPRVPLLKDHLSQHGGASHALIFGDRFAHLASVYFGFAKDQACVGLGGSTGAPLFAGPLSVLDLRQLTWPLRISVSSSVKGDNTSRCVLCCVDFRSKYKEAAPDSAWPVGEQHCRWRDVGQLVDLH